VTERLNIVAVHAYSQHLLPRVRSSGVASGAVFVAGGNESVLFSSTQALHWRKEYAGGIVDGAVASIASAGQTLIIGTNNSFSFSSDDGTFHRVGACVHCASPLTCHFLRTYSCCRYEGLSMSNVSSLATLATDEGTQIFAGTASGVVVGPFLLSRPQAPVEHRYFNGPRWLAAHSAEADDNSVLYLAAFTGKGWSTGISGSNGGVWCATRKGLSLLEAVPITLEYKSEHLQASLLLCLRCRHRTRGLYSHTHHCRL
jgi:hypothetical protein